MADASSPERRTRSIDFLCEEERIRRLGERIRRDHDDSSELSRERRARGLAKAIRIHGLNNSTLTAPAQRAAGPSPAAQPVAQAAPFAAPAALPAAASATAAPALLPPQAASSAARPAREPQTTAALEPKDRLNDALDQVTVKGIVDLRGVAEPSPELEAVAVAALRLLSGQAREANADAAPPPETWADVKRALLKPGHFVNALRRFPYAADRGQVPEADICDVEEVLAEVPPHGEGLAEVHPMAAHLYAWVRAALEYAAWSHTRLDSVASPARAGAGAQQRPAEPAAWPVQQGVAAAPSSSVSLGVSWATAQAQASEALDMAGALYNASPNAAPAAAPRPGTFGGPPVAAQLSVPGTLGSPPAQGGGYGGAPSTVRARSPAASKTSPARRQVSPRPRSPVAVMPVDPEDAPPLSTQEVEEYNRKLEQTKREVREIRALQDQVKFSMEREEKKEVEAAKKDADVEIMEWRNEQNMTMKEHAAELAKTQRVEDLEASKEFQTFKREVKAIKKDEELQEIKEQYANDTEFSQLQADIAKMAVADRHALVLETLEEIQDQREIKTHEVLREKHSVEQDRAHEVRLAYNHEANKLAAEKEELLASLQLMRQRQKVPVASNRGLATAGARRR